MQIEVIVAIISFALRYDRLKGDLLVDEPVPQELILKLVALGKETSESNGARHRSPIQIHQPKVHDHLLNLFVALPDSKWKAGENKLSSLGLINLTDRVMVAEDSSADLQG